MVEDKTVSHYDKYKETYKRYYEKHRDKRQEYNREYYKSYKGSTVECTTCGKTLLEKNMRFHLASKYHTSKST